MALTLVSLLWEDILFKHVLNKLSIRDLFVLRGLSREYKSLVDAYLEYLQELNLTPYCDRIGVDAFQVLAQRCRRLQKVILSCCNWLTDELVTPLFMRNTNITYLVLNNCQNLTSACLQDVIVFSKRLKCLKLVNCSWFSVGCLEAMTLHQADLEEVDFCACTNIVSTHALNCFIKKFSNLRNVCFAYLSCVTNSTLFALALSCKKLEHINLRFCHLITDDGLRVLVDGCTSLKSISVTGCDLVSERYLNNLRRKFHVDRVKYARALSS